jgi:hypothetical protein
MAGGIDRQRHADFLGQEVHAAALLCRVFARSCPPIFGMPRQQPFGGLTA